MSRRPAVSPKSTFPRWIVQSHNRNLLITNFTPTSIHQIVKPVFASTNLLFHVDSSTLSPYSVPQLSFVVFSPPIDIMDVDGQQHHFGVQLLPEVDQRHFHVHLLPILRHIANADFVAFDLEMSGIGTSPKRPSKPSIQEVYEDVKAAAETYQVLQVGITCVEKDEANGSFPFFLFQNVDKLLTAHRHLCSQTIQFQSESPLPPGRPSRSRTQVLFLQQCTPLSSR